MKDCILILAGNEPDDLADLNRCLALVGHNVLPFCRGKVDVLIFYEAAFERFKREVVSTFPLRFVPVEFVIPSYPPEIAAAIPEFFPHPTQTAVGRKGFPIGYRHMCRFFAGAMYDHPALADYRRYLRLDTDSAVLTPLGYDLFAWAEERNVGYGYLAPGVQVDCPLVGEGFRELVQNWLDRVPAPHYRPLTLRNLEGLTEHMVYYTNLELSDLRWFRGREYRDFFRMVDQSGGIYTWRWGDHLIKYVGVNLFMELTRIVPLTGFTYQHGAVFRV